MNDQTQPETHIELTNYETAVLTDGLNWIESTVFVWTEDWA